MSFYIYLFNESFRYITVIFTFWLFWSGMFDVFHITLGIISSLIIVQWTGSLFVKTQQTFSRRFTSGFVLKFIACGYCGKLF